MSVSPVPPPSQSSLPSREGASWKGSIQILFAATGISLVASLLAAGSWRGGAYLLVWATAAWFAAFLLGLIFAIPRARSAGGDGDAGHSINNNLADISDWFTKIVAGLGLVHLTEAAPFLKRLGGYIEMSGPEGADKVGAGAALAVVVGFSSLGFLSGYLATRLHFQSLFARADRDVTDLAKTQEGASVANARLSISQKPAATHSAEAAIIAAVPLETLASPADVGLWARARLQIGDYQSAITGYRRALSFVPEDPRFLAELGLAYAKSGQHAEAHLQLEKARKFLSPNSPDLLRKDVFKWLTYNALYLPVPKGAEIARTEGESYLAEPGTIPSGGILINLACAYGQLLNKALTSGETLDELTAPDERALWRDRAIELIRTALVLDAAWSARLQGLAGLRTSEGGTDEQADDDLTVFRDYRPFLQLVHSDQSRKENPGDSESARPGDRESN